MTDERSALDAAEGVGGNGLADPPVRALLVGELLLSVNRSSTPTAVPLGSISSLTPVAGCDR